MTIDDIVNKDYQGEFHQRFPEFDFMGGDFNIEIRMNCNKDGTSEPTGDIYLATVSKDARYMHIRTKHGEILEVYPRATEEDFKLFKDADLSLLDDYNNTSPFVSEDWKSGEHTHLYGGMRPNHVLSPLFQIRGARVILRWNKGNKDWSRFYDYEIEVEGANTKITGYDDPKTPVGVYYGYYNFNDGYKKAVRLVEEEALKRNKYAVSPEI